MLNNIVLHQIFSPMENSLNFHSNFPTYYYYCFAIKYLKFTHLHKTTLIILSKKE